MPPAGMTGGQQLGNAQGKISVDVSDLAKLQAVSAQAGQTVARNLGVIDGAAKRAQSSLGSVTNSLSGVLGAFGVATGGAAIVAQLTRLTLQADATATAYRRQSVAAVELAGNQRNLTALLTEYSKATGNQIDKAQSLADVTKLQAIGFADSAAELNEFVTAARGISLAMGSSQEYIIGQLQLAIANQSTMRLDQIGLGVEEVETRIKSLMAADSNLTKAVAYQNAVLGLATEKYGKLAKSLEAQATGAEKASKAWKDLQLQLGEAVSTPVDQVMGLLARQLDLAAEGLRSMARDLDFVQKQVAKPAPPNSWLTALVLGAANAAGLMPLLTARGPSSSLAENTLGGRVRNQQALVSQAQGGLDDARARGDIAGVLRMTGIVNEASRELAKLKAQLMAASLAAERFSRAGTSGLDISALPQAARRTTSGPSYTAGQTDAIKQWSTDVQAIEREAAASRLSATKQYEQQRAETIADYGRQVVREEADFARNRTRAIADYAKAVADAQADAAEQEADAAKSYAKAVANVREDAGKRDAKWQRDYADKIAELRADSNERLIELDADYAKARERAELDHRDRLMGAAARLDAVGVFEEQRAYARQQADAKENYDEQRNKIKKALEEQLADALESQQERLEESREADRERLADLQESFEEQRAEARKNDAQRLVDMQEDFDERIKRENEDRAVALQRQAEDHAAQLAQMATAQAERMASIAEQEAREKKSLEEKFLAEMEAEGIHNENWLKIQAERSKASLKLWEDFWKEIEKKFAPQGPKTEAEAQATAWPQSFADGGWVQRGGMARVHSGEFVVPAGQARAMAGGMARNISIGDINVYGSPGMSTDGLAAAVRRELMAALEEAA